MIYKCTTPRCLLAESNAPFAAAINCPVCQQALVAETTEVKVSEKEMELITALPYVIAYPLKRALEEKHPWTKVNLLKDTFLNYLKYLGLLTASEFFNSDLKNRRMVDAFQKNLAQPSFGSWNAFIRECIAFLKEQNHVFFYPELVAYYEVIETGSRRKLYKGEIEYIDSNGDAQLKKQESTAIGLLINFRNRYLGHGLTLDEQASQQLWNEYFPVFKTLLEQMSFAKEYPMLKREHGETYLLQGSELKEINSAHTLDGSIWIENKQGEAFEILPFYIVPGALALAKEDKEQVLSYESFTGKTIKFFSPEGSEKQTSGVILDKLNLLLRNKQKETSFSPETFTKEVFLTRIEEENKLVLDTLIQEKKVIEGIYQHRETIEIKLREWIGARANIFFIAAEAGSGKTNLLVEIQKQYSERQLPCLFIRAARMEKSSLKEQIAYQLNLDTSIDLKEYKSIAGKQAEPTFILIDGLNEASIAEVIWNEILEISTFFEPGSLKFVITNRANSKADLERYAFSEELEQLIYSESKERDNDKGLASQVFWLTPLDMKEMEGAWDAYVKKEKARFKPLFSFNDLATFDRGLYLQINNPLVLRIFLETYQGKNLPKETKHLHIWKDWFATFSENEQVFMRALADAIWEKGENEVELEELLNDIYLKEYILTDNISGPYNRLLNLGWVSRYHKDLTSYVSFTVEGLLLYLLGVKLYHPKTINTITEIEVILTYGAKLQKSAIESFLCELALEGEINLISQLIDDGEEKLELCLTPLLYFLKAHGVDKMIKKLFHISSKNDWKALLLLVNNLDKLEMDEIKNQVIKNIKPYNTFKFTEEVSLGFIGHDYQSMLENFKVQLEIILENEGEDNLKVASLYHDFGKVYKEQYFYSRSKDYFEKSLNVYIKLLGQTDHRLSHVYDSSGNLFYSIGDYDKAMECFIKSLDIRLKTLGKEHIDLVTSYNNIGKVYFNKGDNLNAMDCYNFSLKILLKNNVTLYPLVANVYINIANILLKNNEFENAFEFYQKSLEIKLKNLGRVHKSLAEDFNNIGELYFSKGEFDISLNFFQKCLEIGLKTLGEEHRDVANSYNSIGLVLEKKTEYDKAIKFYQKCLEIYLKILGETHPDVAETYNNIGLAFSGKGDNDKALVYFQKALEIQLKTYGEDHPFVLNSFTNIAWAYSDKGDLNKALEFQEKILAIELKKENPSTLDLATVYGNIGYILIQLDKLELAIENLKKVFEIEKKGGVPFQIAQSYEDLNDKANALDYYIQSAEIRKERIGLEDQATQESISNSLRLAKELGKENELPEWMI
jgi:tetratricopeptide (TPR) repeat protein